MEWKYSVWKQGMRMGWVNLKMHQFISHQFKSFSHLFEALPAKQKLSTKLWAPGSRRPSSRKFHSASIDRPVFEPRERRWPKATAEMGGGKGSRIDLFWGMDLRLSLESKLSLKDVLKQLYLILSIFCLNTGVPLADLSQPIPAPLAFNATLRPQGQVLRGSLHAAQMRMAGRGYRLFWHLHPSRHWLWHMLCPQRYEHLEGVKLQSTGNRNARAD